MFQRGWIEFWRRRGRSLDETFWPRTVGHRGRYLFIMAGLPMRKCKSILLFLLLGMAAGAGPAPSGEQAEFFEKKIRPVLVEICFKCHSASSEKLKGALKLDSREAALAGGESGKPALVPGEPEKSLIIEAVRYGNAD